MENPFIISGYKSDEYFCDREFETKRILLANKSRRNLTLYSLRRIGKTGLIYHIFNKLSNSKNFIVIYVDISISQNLSVFSSIFANSIVKNLESGLDKGINLLRNFKPKITYDQLTGKPALEMSFNSNREIFYSINESFEFLRKKSKEKKIVIAIDEFQQITQYPEKGVEALLRSEIQKSPDISFIFSGSKKHLMLSIFGEYSRPFYQSTEMMHLEKISFKEYSEFIKNHFISNKMKIEDKEIEFILDWTRIHTYYVQYLCSKVFDEDYKDIKRENIEYVMMEILRENENYYLNYRNLLTDHQWKLLRAIAKNISIDKPMSIDFIKKYDLNSPSSVNVSLKALLKKDVIYEENERYYVSDVFFSRWLENIP